MSKIFPLIMVLSLMVYSTIAQKDLNYYLTDKINYNEAIPTPESVLGYHVGEWHVSHGQLVHYMQALAAASERISIEEIGRTYEQRPLLMLKITSVKNHKNLEAIRREHIKLANPEASGTLNIGNMPAVLWMGYSVHGNEPSGSNASMLVAYYLAAAQSDEIENMLANTVILLDPSVNPDGLNRFASWVNTHRSKNLVTDPNSVEFDEAWPRGRTNHYWFDMNRDWLPVQHPGSRARINKFHEWKPNVLTDHHEMGRNASFFFQPGIPSRNHPLTPQNNYEITRKIAAYHADALDSIGSFYYTEESYDDFYYGKGSTYPDVNGAVGILFEQASSRGHAQESDNGILEFAFTIKNQFNTSLSTLKATYDLRVDLLNYQRRFYQSAIEEAAENDLKAYVFSSEADEARAYHLADIIKQHDITIYRLNETLTINDKNYNPNTSYIVPLEQPQARLIKAMFEERTSFEDSLFYDVSAWTLPRAFNLKFDALHGRSFNSNLLGEKIDCLNFPEGEIIGGKSNYAYLFEWDEYYSPRALNRLFEKDIMLRIATKPMTNDEGKVFDRGTILVPVSSQRHTVNEVHAIISEIASKDGIDVYAMNTGLSAKGISLGSPSFALLEKPKIMMLIHGGVSSYEAGEVWHLLDQRFDMKVTMIPVENFNHVDIDKYNTLVMVDGRYNELSAEKLRHWIQQGGNVIAMQGAAKWLADNDIGKITFQKNETDSTRQQPYATLYNNRGAQVIGGAIFNATLDLTNPIGYGYNKEEINVFRNNTFFLERGKNPYANPLMYTSEPLVSGYISEENKEKLKNSAAIGVYSVGKGRIIAFSDNPNFRAFWFGTNKLFMNSLLFGSIISQRAAE